MTLWRPIGPCDDGCIPTPSASLGRLRIALRLAGTATVLLAALPLIALTPQALRPRRGTQVATLLLRCLGIALAGPPARPLRGSLVVVNHISWLDILVLLAWGDVAMVAKTEVRQWPLIGRLAAGVGTLFVDRSAPRRLPDTVAEVSGALRGGRSVAVFAEGTTGCGRTVLPFRPAMFQAAIDVGAPIVPVTLAFDPVGLAGYLGDESLWESVRRVVRAPRLTATIHTGRVLYPAPSADRRWTARLCRTAVAGRLPLAPNDLQPAACLADRHLAVVARDGALVGAA